MCANLKSTFDVSKDLQGDSAAAGPESTHSWLLSGRRNSLLQSAALEEEPLALVSQIYFLPILAFVILIIILYQIVHIQVSCYTKLSMFL